MIGVRNGSDRLHFDSIRSGEVSERGFEGGAREGGYEYPVFWTRGYQAVPIGPIQGCGWASFPSGSGPPIGMPWLSIRE